MEENLQTTRSDLKLKENQVDSLSNRMEQMKEELEKIRSDLKPIEDQVDSLSKRMGQMEEKLEKIRSDLKQKEDQVESLFQGSSLKPGEGMDSLSNRSDLKLKEDQVESLIQGSALKPGEGMDSLSNRMEHMEKNLEKTRSALSQKDKELKSFKDRVAVDVNLSMKTGKTFESMNSPVSRSRLKEMYEELWRQWHKIKTHLKSNKENPESVKKLIQEKFKEAMLDMEKKKQHIDEAFRLDELSRRPASEEDQQYRLSTCQNLQLVLYHRGTEGGDLKTLFSGFEGGKPQEVKDYWFSKCYWLGCLMALNNPPLHPDWENHPPSMDKWDFFPRNFTAASGK